MAKKSKLDIAKVLYQFDKNEAANSHRKGTFKINEPFERALDSLLKSKATKKHK